MIESFFPLFRGLFIIDTKGILRQITMNDLPVRSLVACLYHLLITCVLVAHLSLTQVGRSVDETLRLVQAFQYTDHKGEGVCVCPYVYLTI